MKYMDAALTAGIKVGNVAEWCRVNGVNRRTFYRHQARIEAEGAWAPRSRRPATSPGRTPAVVEDQVVRLRRELSPDLRHIITTTPATHVPRQHTRWGSSFCTR
jgi:putative transposase